MTTIHDPSEAITDTQQPIPGLAESLPEYHGRKPVGMRTKLTGYGNRTMSPHTIGDRFVLVLEVRCKSATHDDTDDGLVYIESDKVLDMFELHGDPGARLLGTMRSLAKQSEDAAAGRVPIAGMKIHTDASGVVLTDDELAELRGDPVRAVLADQLTPAVVVYQDGTRAMWPDDFKANTPRPMPGTIVEDDNVTFEVVELLHHETGETIAIAGDAIAAAVSDAGAPMPPEFAHLMRVAETIDALTDDLLDEWLAASPEERSAVLGGMSEERQAAVLEAIGTALRRRSAGVVGDAGPEMTDLAGGEVIPDPDAAWSEPDPATEKRLADAAAVETPESIEKGKVSDVLAAVARITDPAMLNAILAIERTRPRPRKQVETAIGDRIAALEDGDA